MRLMPHIVVQDDKILRFLQVILDPDVSPERVEAFRDYLSFDIDDPLAWFDDQRQNAHAIHPSRVTMVEDEDAMFRHYGSLCCAYCTGCASCIR